MKIKRLTKEYGGGSGNGIFESELFDVTVWSLQKGTKTTIRSKLHCFLELDFDGEHKFLSDESCMEQLNCDEIVEMVRQQKEKSFEEGKYHKANEIISCLGLGE